MLASFAKAGDGDDAVLRREARCVGSRMLNFFVFRRHRDGDAFMRGEARCVGSLNLK